MAKEHILAFRSMLSKGNVPKIGYVTLEIQVIPSERKSRFLTKYPLGKKEKTAWRKMSKKDFMGYEENRKTDFWIPEKIMVKRRNFYGREKKGRGWI